MRIILALGRSQRSALLRAVRKRRRNRETEQRTDKVILSQTLHEIRAVHQALFNLHMSRENPRRIGVRGTRDYRQEGPCHRPVQEITVPNQVSAQIHPPLHSPKVLQQLQFFHQEEICHNFLRINL